MDKYKEILSKSGFVQIQIGLPIEINKLVRKKDWKKIDLLISDLLKPNQLLSEKLSHFIVIKNTEHIISIRKGGDDEDGIWHDDGSRELAFTLSLNEFPESVIGGELEFRRKGEESLRSIKLPAFGTLNIFKTGGEGYEHRVLKVIEGERIIVAGWLNR